MRMASLVFRLGVLLLSVLLQVGSWHAEASSSSSAAAPPPPMLGEFDLAEDDSSEELTAADDTLESMLVGAYHHGCYPAPSRRFRRVEEGLPAGGPPLDAPFKPPRA
ncbi:MAG TPA: hypothetical protein VNN80_05490 [Polyangiaceae bacterium]|jgi:hypothetical protein|nr:hypothetical protein [Polyangiaceae bacterium]